mmetsp:Transcript_26789/g.63556  ORF Transcript_26789/g.63556 Transcript_26789/m.63556 type:complete len:244 (-) Transcript_26789:549-1280(-)
MASMLAESSAFSSARCSRLCRSDISSDSAASSFRSASSAFLAFHSASDCCSSKELCRRDTSLRELASLDPVTSISALSSAISDRSLFASALLLEASASVLDSSSVAAWPFFLRDSMTASASCFCSSSPLALAFSASSFSARLALRSVTSWSSSRSLPSIRWREAEFAFSCSRRSDTCEMRASLLRASAVDFSLSAARSPFSVRASLSAVVRSWCSSRSLFWRSFTRCWCSEANSSRAASSASS